MARHLTLLIFLASLVLAGCGGDATTAPAPTSPTGAVNPLPTKPSADKSVAKKAVLD